MRMRFKRQLSALVAAAGYLPVAPPAGTLRRSRAKAPRPPSDRLACRPHLWPPHERSRRPEWSSAVPGKWSTERGSEARA